MKLSDGTEIEWYLWKGDRPKIHSYAHDKGYIAALYNEELYDVRRHHSTFRRFGITHSSIRERLTLIARPPISGTGSFGVYPDTARNSLRVKGSKRAGEALPWDEWGEEFAHNLPTSVIDAIKESLPSSTGTLDDEKWRDRLSERFGSRWKKTVRRVDLKGTLSVTPVDSDGSKPKKPKKPKKTEKGGKSFHGGGKGGSSGSNSTGTTSGPKAAKLSSVATGVPNYRWSSESEVEGGSAAVFAPSTSCEPAGLVILNEDFAPFVEVVKHWQSFYPDQYATQIRQTVHEVYGQAMVARVAHSQVLAKDANWGQKRVEEELRSPASLTMAALGLINEDYMINAKLSGLIGMKKKAT